MRQDGDQISPLRREKELKIDVAPVADIYNRNTLAELEVDSLA